MDFYSEISGLILSRKIRSKEELHKTKVKLCKKYKRDTSEIKKSLGLWTRLFSSEDEMNAAIKESATTRNIPLDEYRVRIGKALWGTADSMRIRLKAFEEIGVEHFIFMFPHGQEIDHIKAMGKSVINKF